jgi:hypothetical protein
MRNRSFIAKEEVDNGWTTRQIRKENAVGNRTFRLPKMQETIPRSTKQEESLNSTRWRFKLILSSPYFSILKKR